MYHLNLRKLCINLYDTEYSLNRNALVIQFSKWCIRLYLPYIQYNKFTLDNITFYNTSLAGNFIFYTICSATPIIPFGVWSFSSITRWWEQSHLKDSRFQIRIRSRELFTLLTLLDSVDIETQIPLS